MRIQFWWLRVVVLSLISVACTTPSDTNATHSSLTTAAPEPAPPVPSVPLKDEPPAPSDHKPESESETKADETTAEPRDVAIRLRPEVFQFEPNSSRLTLQSRIMTLKVGAALGSLSGLWSALEVAGHSDGNSTRPQRNQRLSEERAEVVRQVLLSKGVYGRTTTSKGYGVTRPLSGVDPKASENRRIELYFKEVKDPEKLTQALAEFMPQP